MKAEYSQFVYELLKQIDELRPLYDEHLEDNDILLKHVFLGDVTRFVASTFEKTPDSSVLLRILDFLENALNHGDERTQELIVVSFLENILKYDCYDKLKPLLKPNMLNALEAFDLD